MYTNADQLTLSKKHELQTLSQNEKPHIIAICEVKTKVGALKNLHEYEFGEYTQANQTNVNNTKGRGILILAHNSIKHLIVKVAPMEFEEACSIEVRLSAGDLLLFACLYRSPSKTKTTDEDNIKLNTLMRTISSEKKYSHNCIIGDFNLPTINWENWTTPHGEDSKEERFLDAIRDSFLYQHIDEPTRCRGTDDPSTIDLIFTCEQNQVQNLQYLSPLGKSDHSVLSFTFDCYSERKANSKRYTYDAVDYTILRQFLSTNDWSNELQENINGKSVNQSWKLFKDKILELRNRFVPLKETDCQHWNKRKGAIPIGIDLQNEVREKGRLHRKWVRSTCPVERSHNRQVYITARNRVNRMMSRARRRYEKNICNKSKTKPKVFWSHVRGKMKSASGVSPLLETPNDKSSLKHEDHEKASILQKQFCSVFTIEPEGQLPDFPRRTQQSIDEIVITKEMVKQRLKELDTNKSFGPDEMHPKFLKELAENIAEPLTVIMNRTLQEGTLPEDWKLAHVTPIYKNKGAQNLAVNYRPVSLTSIVCKLMESILREHVIGHLTNLKLLSNKQYGFISKRSTVTQLLKYIDQCCESLSNGKVVDSIYFDFAKAFDTVPHRRLCKKLKGYGIEGQIFRWIKSFLHGRKQLVRVKEARSSENNVVSGIPQGSVLGPLLFVIYINDLPDKVVSNLLLFADDTKIFKEVNSIHDSLAIQEDIDALEEWSKDWLLSFHPDKCHVLTLGKLENIKHAHPYSLGGNQLEHVFSEKDLGILIDAELSFDEHIAKQVNKANSVLGIISRGFENLTPNILYTLYCTFVRPHLEYAQSVWAPKLRKHVNLIEGVQRRATRLVQIYKTLPYEERLRRMDLPTLEFRRKFCDMVQVYKHLNFYDKETTPQKFIKRIRPNRYHNEELQPIFAEDGFRGPQTKSFYYRTIPAWNKLPSDVVTAKSIKEFKIKLKVAWEKHPLKFCNL